MNHPRLLLKVCTHFRQAILERETTASFRGSTPHYVRPLPICSAICQGQICYTRHSPRLLSLGYLYPVLSCLGGAGTDFAGWEPLLTTVDPSSLVRAARGCWRCKARPFPGRQGGNTVRLQHVVCTFAVQSSGCHFTQGNAKACDLSLIHI